MELISIIILSISSYFDLRERRVPNWITYSGTALGILLSLFAGYWQIVPYVAIVFIVAYALYRVGLWAGGDVKLFTALSALNPPFIELFGYSIPFPLALFFLSILLAFLLSFPIMLSVILLRKELRNSLLSSIPVITAKSFSISVIASAFGFLGLLFLFFPPPVDLFISLSLLLWRPTLDFLPAFATVFFFALFFRVLSMRVYVFRKEKNLDELEEGDVPVDFIMSDGRRIPFSWKNALIISTQKLPVRLSPLRAAGLYKEDIEWLRSKGIERLSVRTTMPFVPFVAVAYLCLLAVIYLGG